MTGHEHVFRLKELAQERDAAKTSVEETVKHIESAQRRTEKLMTDDTRVIDTYPRKRKRRPSQHKRKRKTARKATKAMKRKRSGRSRTR